MTVIVLGVVFFTLIILILVGFIIESKKRLVPQGKLKIIVNNDKENPIIVNPGEKLLNALANNQIFVSSACGGGGSCGQCKVKVLDKEQKLLPTEKSHINKKQAKEGYRLSCQLPVKKDLRIELPPEIFSAKKMECEVISNDNVATFIKEFTLKLPEGIDLDFEAGGYIQIIVPPYEVDFKDFDIGEQYIKDWQDTGLLSLKSKVDEEVIRAYSMANYPLEKGIIKLNVRIATPPLYDCTIPPGKGSSYIFSRKPGDKVMIMGPFGEFKASDTDAEMVFIGGGAGMAPLRSIIFDQLLRLNSKRKISFWYGARSLKEIFYKEDFDNLAKKYDNFTWNVALSQPLPEDNWTGYTGFIHTVVYENYLKNHPAPEDVEYYLCGPPMMLDSVLNMLDSLGVEKENIRFDDFGS
ncbi:NADH:ubiquinone reductase (Na(+)-transporting) subunit F [Deferribacterales bacterium Es71-Z0220]|jgi:Na+-transporting NADH:ubiquinone oxidoreductase subunit F|uniref:NADH:ubiquinone reductase (Na(+)-transporting) subunit F n=1 Tax=Deferrivibrio essentukiensis TaxID=2880922 RepID=UPI001F61EAF4|nr:NADH:ubiquinone reductase (Na(+)-transporting) subunit F [Deferrivibrio essentukiensis]MBZ4672138.1 nqrF [Deferribacteraceae bacterium]MCB4204330.1 NADH:ubiquinone reductase (Na(+)-transporting) subunit F [Deferrivibrio essentukiensis]